MKPKVIAKDLSTEEKIREAAKTLFIQKGYAATRTRDIADLAGINLALLNYYFRSKEKLFNLVMMDVVQSFMKILRTMLDDESTTLAQKLKTGVNNYINLLLENPQLPTFFLNIMQAPTQELEQLLSQLSITPRVVRNLSFFKQMEKQKRRSGSKFDSMQLLVNLISLCIFPFAAKPALDKILGVGHNEFAAMMEQRRALIPLWMRGMLNMQFGK
ncbi:MAG: TetR family transcriptional regulator [Prevotellaceae bacterium]|jgi:AcrR family transcriptional regulator|nr:TetR family transcriptional regulator [Prevotellaceae bacterium]